ncbi:MAG: hypothetical protein AMK69_12020, partial [Nitrospira bacterium SG8_3]
MRSLRDCFVDSMARHGDRKAITFLRGGNAESEISYRELDLDSNRMANTCLGLGVAKGDRVILFFPKSMIFVAAHLALQKIGAVAVPLNPGFKPSEMEYFIEDAKAQLVLSGSEHQAMIKEIDPSLSNLVIDTQESYQNLDFFRSASEDLPPVEIGPDDPGIIIYTSGTTGKPKGAVLTQKNLVHDAKNVIKIWEITESDVLCHALPLFHVHRLCFPLHTSL